MKNVYADSEMRKVTAALSGLGLKYEKTFKGTGVGLGLKCGRLPVALNILVAPETELVRISAVLPLLFPPSTFDTGLEAITRINYNLAFGHFDIDPLTGKIFFNATLSYIGCVPSVDTYTEILRNSFELIHLCGEQLARRIVVE